MGTSGAYGGSGGSWGGAQDALDEWLDSLPGGDAPADTGEGPGDHDPAPGASDGSDARPPERDPFAGVSPLLRQVFRAAGQGMLGVSGGGGGRADGPGGGGAARGAGGRSASRVGRVGSRAIGGAVAYRSADAEALTDLGLSLDELRAARSDRARAKMLVDAAMEAPPGDIESEQLSRAAADVVLWVMDHPDAPMAEVIGEFVSDYVYRVLATELGSVTRRGDRNEAEAEHAERTLRTLVRGLTRGALIDVDTQVDVAEVIQSVYSRTVTIMSDAS